MSSAAQTAMDNVSRISDNPKLRDLKNATIDLTNESGLTTDHGVKVPDTDNWYISPKVGFSTYSHLWTDRLKVSDGQHNGPSLLEDQIAREKIHRFDHERIPERVVHARGFGAHGHFRAVNDGASKYTFAPVLTDTSRETPIFIRFSTVAGSRGSAVSICASFDLARFTCFIGYRQGCSRLRDEVLYP